MTDMLCKIEIVRPLDFFRLMSERDWTTVELVEDALQALNAQKKSFQCLLCHAPLLSSTDTKAICVVTPLPTEEHAYAAYLCEPCEDQDGLTKRCADAIATAFGGDAAKSVPLDIPAGHA